MGIETESSFAANPDGLSLCNTSVPLPLGLVDHVSSAENGTSASVCQLPKTFAGPSATTRPLLSSNLTGKLASNDQLPGTLPIIPKGLVTFSLLSGENTVIDTDFFD